MAVRQEHVPPDEWRGPTTCGVMWGVTVNAHLVTKGADPAAPWSGVNPSTVLGNDIAFDANGAMWVWREPPATSTENKPAARPIPDPPGPPPVRVQ